MTRKTRILAGTAAFALAGGAVLVPPVMADPIPQAATYADLLEPVPDAMTRIHADDALATTRMAIPGGAQMIPTGIDVGIGINLHHHHHHHHHHHAGWYRAHGYYWNGYGWVVAPPPYWHHHHADWYRAQNYYWDGRVWVPRARYHHHHHHHHHHHWR